MKITRRQLRKLIQEQVIQETLGKDVEEITLKQFQRLFDQQWYKKLDSMVQEGVDAVMSFAKSINMDDIADDIMERLSLENKSVRRQLIVGFMQGLLDYYKVAQKVDDLARPYSLNDIKEENMRWMFDNTLLKIMVSDSNVVKTIYNIMKKEDSVFTVGRKIANQIIPRAIDITGGRAGR